MVPGTSSSLSSSSLDSRQVVIEVADQKPMQHQQQAVVPEAGESKKDEITSVISLASGEDGSTRERRPSYDSVITKPTLASGVSKYIRRISSGYTNNTTGGGGARSTADPAPPHDVVIIPTFQCPICYETLPITEKFLPASSVVAAAGEEERRSNTTTMTPRPCPHSFCKTCLSSYITNNTNESILVNNCPMRGDQQCNYVFREEDIASLVAPDILRKYQKFRLMKSNENYRECPNPSCQTMILGDAENPSQQMMCPACHTEFCFVHNNAHPGMSCLDYTRKNLKKEEAANRRILKRMTKACPNCHVNTEKSGGCNHMTCVHCQYQWCWICGRAYTADHYSPTNVLGGCPGAQFTDCFAFYGIRSAVVLMWIYRMTILLLVLPIILSLLLLAQAVWLAVFPLFICCYLPVLRGYEGGYKLPFLYFIFPIIGAIQGDLFAFDILAKVLVSLSLLCLFPIQLAFIPIGLVLGGLAILLMKMGVCNFSGERWEGRGEDGQPSPTEILMVACFVPTGIWGVCLQLMGLLGEDPPEDANNNNAAAAEEVGGGARRGEDPPAAAEVVVVDDQGMWGNIRND